MSVVFSRRKFVAGATAALGSSVFPIPAFAQNAPLRIGLHTIKTGPLATGGIQMEQGFTTFLKQRNYQLAGRKVELFTVDTGGTPAGGRTKAQELVELRKVDIIVGVLSSFELLAISDYVIQTKTPLIAHAASDPVTQQKFNPFLIRPAPTSSQCIFPLADYAAKELKLKTVITIANDYAFGYEQTGGFQRVFEDAGGTVVKKLWPPLVTPDYTPYLAQIRGADALVAGFAGSNPVQFMKQYADQGLKLPVLGSFTMSDDALLRSFGDEAIGMINASPYSIDYNTPMNKWFIDEIVKVSGNLPGFYHADLYSHGMLIEAALQKTGGKTDDREAFMQALRSVVLTDTPRGPVKFDQRGQAISDMHIRRMEKHNGQLISKTIKTYPNVGQFWTYDEKSYLSRPPYSRNYPPLKS